MGIGGKISNINLWSAVFQLPSSMIWREKWSNKFFIRNSKNIQENMSLELAVSNFTSLDMSGKGDGTFHGIQENSIEL